MKTQVTARGGLTRQSGEAKMKNLMFVCAGEERYTSPAFYRSIIQELKSGEPTYVVLHDSVNHPMVDYPELQEFSNARFIIVPNIGDVGQQLSQTRQVVERTAGRSKLFARPTILLAINHPTAMQFVDNKLGFRPTSLQYSSDLADKIFVTLDLTKLQEFV